MQSVIYNNSDIIKYNYIARSIIIQVSVTFIKIPYVYQDQNIK
jgi:hypothetical protein